MTETVGNLADRVALRQELCRVEMAKIVDRRSVFLERCVRLGQVLGTVRLQAVVRKDPVARMA